MHIIQRILTHNFVKNLSITTMGSLGSQVIMIAGTLIITRLYTPEDFGILSIINSIVLILASLATLNLDNAILIAKKEDTYRLLRTALIMCLVFSTLSFLVIGIINFIDLKLISRSYIRYLLLVPIWVFIYRFSFSLKETLIKQEKYKQIAKGTVTKSLFANIFQITLSIVDTSGLTLIIGRLLGEILGLFAFLNKKIVSELKQMSSYTKKAITQTVKDYRDFVKYDYYQEIIAVFTQNLIIIVLGYFYSATIVGVYSIAVKLLKAPINLLGENIRHVFLRNLTEKEPKKIRIFYFRTMSLLFGITFFPFLIIYLFAPQIFSLFFDGDWVKAGQYAKYLTPWFFTYIMSQPAIGFIKYIRKIHNLAKFQTISIFAKMTVIILSGLYFTDVQLVQNLSITGTALELSIIIYSLYALNIHHKNS
jgi:lipopolysaccharide exporter